MEDEGERAGRWSGRGGRGRVGPCFLIWVTRGIPRAGAYELAGAWDLIPFPPWLSPQSWLAWRWPLCVIASLPPSVQDEKSRYKR